MNGETNKLAVAIQSKLIKDSSIAELNEVLRKVMLKIGLRAQNLPNELETLVLREHIIANYGGNRLNEIPLAFDFLLRGELADGDGEVVDSNCYENFSCLYFSKVMNAYRHWSRQEVKFISPTTKAEQKIFTQDELDDYAREEAEWTYQMYLKGFEITYPEGIRTILEKDNLIKKEELVMDFFKRKATNLKTNIYTK